MGLNATLPCQHCGPAPPSGSERKTRGAVTQPLAIQHMLQPTQANWGACPLPILTGDCCRSFQDIEIRAFVFHSVTFSIFLQGEDKQLSILNNWRCATSPSLSWKKFLNQRGILTAEKVSSEIPPTLCWHYSEKQRKADKTKELAGVRVSHFSSAQAHNCQLTPSEHSLSACSWLQDFILSCIRCGTWLSWVKPPVSFSLVNSSHLNRDLGKWPCPECARAMAALHHEYTEMLNDNEAAL